MKAERFDFTMAEQFYVLNIDIDEYGERITSTTEEQGRVISKEGMSIEEPSYAESEYEELDEKGNVIEKPVAIIPIDQLLHVYYFQYRLDELIEPFQDPKICIGVCRDTFRIDRDLSQQHDVWCLNLNTGDKFSKHKWKDYYDIDVGSNPKYGHFIHGSVIGVMLDMDRGIITFYKDGNDLGQAFVQKDLKEGTLYPFIQVQTECELSIFHPFVYPAYRPPVPEEEEHSYVEETF